MRGMFITFEGADGCGKSTHISLLCEALQARGYEVVVTREPGGCPISEKIRDILLDPENAGMTAMSEAMLYAAARAQHVRQVIRPALDQGKIVLSDRFLDSSIAYQGYGRLLGEEVIRCINAPALQGLEPTLTFYLSLTMAGLKVRRDKRGGRDRIEMAGQSFHDRVRQGFEELSLQEEHRIVSVDASRVIHEVQQEILRRTLMVLEGEKECAEPVV